MEPNDAAHAYRRPLALLILTAALALLLAIPGQAGAAINWYGDYEDGFTQHIPPDSQTSTAEGWRGSGYTNVEHTKLISGPHRQGQAAMSVTANPETLGSGGEERVEVDSTLAAAKGGQGDDSWYAWSAYFPSNSPTQAEGVLTQWKLGTVGTNCAAQNPNISLSGIAGLLFLDTSGGRCPGDQLRHLMFPLSWSSVELDAWHDFMVHAHMSSSSHDGFVEAWFDGERVVPRTYTPDLYEDTEQIIPVRLRQGIYRGGNKPESTVYYDAMRVGASYEDVASLNPSFETDLRDWQSTADAGFASGAFERSSAWSSDGGHSLRRGGTHDASSTAFSLGAAQMSKDHGTRVAPGREYEVKVDLHSYNPPASRGYRLRVSWFKADGSASGASDATGEESSAGVVGDLTPTLDVTAPADAAFAQLHVEAVSATPNDSVDFAIDRVRFETDFGESHTGPEMVSNPSFEKGTSGWQSTADKGLSLLGFQASTKWSDELATSLHLEGKDEGSAGQLLSYGVTQPSGSEAMPVQGGHDYFARAVVDSVKAPAAGGYRLRVRWFKPDGTVASTGQSESGLRGQGDGEDILPLFLAVTAPPDAAYASLAIEAATATPGETTEFYVDNATFRSTQRADRADLLHIGTMEPPIPHIGTEGPLFFPSQEVADYALGTDGWDPTWDAGGKAIGIGWLRPVTLDPIDGDWSLKFIGRHDASTTEAIRGVQTAEDTTGIPLEGAHFYRLTDKLRVTDAPAGGIQLAAKMLDSNGKPIAGAVAQSGWHTGTGDFDQSLNVYAPQAAHYIEVSVLAKSAEANDGIDFSLDDVTLVKRHTPRLEAESYAATLAGSGFESFTAHSPTATFPVKCKKTSLAGTLSAPATQLALNGEASECASETIKTTVAMNGCHFNLGVKNAGPPYTGTLGIACGKETERIEYEVIFLGKVRCRAKIVPQSGLEGVSLANVGSGSKRGIEANAEVKGVKYEFEGELCGAKTPETRTDGVIGGKTTLLGKNGAGQAVGSFLTGEGLPLGTYLAGKGSEKEAEQPRLEAESYPLAIAGAGLGSFTAKAGPFSCKNTSWQGSLAAAAKQLSLTGKYSECTYSGSIATTVAMNGCHFNLGVKNAGPPYTGTLGVACSKETERIEYEVIFLGKVRCRAKIVPQSGLEGVTLGNVGSGSERGIEANAEVKGVKYEFEGELCGAKTPETRTDGVIGGKTTLLGVE